MIEGGPACEYASLATLFAGEILARLSGPVLWCLRGRDLFAPALARVGLHSLPHWPTDRLRRKSKDAPPLAKPLVTALMQGQRRVLASVDEAAERHGLRCGMTVTHAQSLLPDLTVVNATPEQDEAGLIRLALWCIRYSPLVTPDPPDGIFIDVAGSAHLFQGEATLIKDLSQRLTAQGIISRAAVADTPGCAWAVARYGKESIILPGRASEGMASLLVAALRLSGQAISSLHEVGIERVAHLASKPRASLRLRFGADVLLRLDQALGSAQEALPSLVPPEVPRAELRFAKSSDETEFLTLTKVEILATGTTPFKRCSCRWF